MLAASLVAIPFSGSDSAEAAAATTTVVVRGTAFPDPLTAQLSFTGYATLKGTTPETVRPIIGNAVVPPSGTRSLGFDLAGGNNSVGALFMRPSMLQTTTAELQVHAAAGTRGVVYAGYQAPADAGTTRVWVGRAEVAVGAGAWQRVSALGLRFAWSKRDLATGAQLAAGPAAVINVPSFVRGHGGDGAGFYSLGFGSDGNAFSIDTLKVGTAGATRVYDLEGLATTTTITGTTGVAPGEPARLTGALRDQSGARVPGSTLLLEQRVGSGPWETVYRNPDGPRPTDPVVVPADATDPQVVVTPERTTSYRFRFVDRPLAEGSASAPFTVAVTPTLTARATAERLVVGRVTPAVDGATVTLRYADGGGALATAPVAADGRYELAVPPEVGGALVVRLDGVDGLEPATSEPVRVEALVSAPPAADPAQPPAETPDETPADEPTEQPTESEAPAEQPTDEPEQEAPAPEQTPTQAPSTPATPAQQPAVPDPATETTTSSP
ncbi:MULTISPECIES: hypothetical protein [unclassified Nocardioides]|uniref:hypothetical protein n=1 Tax=unclassified Nocardioides TaxID=2615069 RepID=UPI003014BC6F